MKWHHFVAQGILLLAGTWQFYYNNLPCIYCSAMVIMQIKHVKKCHFHVELLFFWKFADTVMRNLLYLLYVDKSQAQSKHFFYLMI